MMRAWIVVALVACGGGRSEPATPVVNVAAKPPADAAVDAGPLSVDYAVAKMTEFMTRMCACHEKACTDVVVADLNRWGEEMQDYPKSHARVTDDQARRMADVTERLSKCMTDVMMPPGSGSASP